MKILLYSHDTFGLGHLRRSRTIAHALATEFENAEIAIITGSPFAGTFNFLDQIIYLQIPPVTKRSDGTYTSLENGIDLDYTVASRSKAIKDFIEDWRPDMLVVDKEPLGFRRELMDVLNLAKAKGMITVLGLRDVLDAPDILKIEWERKGVFEHIDNLYNEIWVYGPESFYDPLQDLGLTESVTSKVYYTGFLNRTAWEGEEAEVSRHGFENYILVTAGGGGDGYELMMSTIEMVRLHPDSGDNFLMVLGPFMGTQEGEEIRQSALSVPNIVVIDFDPDLEKYIADSEFVIGMCGYNTFCEVLSFDKHAVYVPRSVPRLEQRIRAYRSASMGWSSVIEISEAANPEIFYQAVKSIRRRRLPSEATLKPDMDGLSKVCTRVKALIDNSERTTSAIRLV
ncbi:MAG: glycosyltransferase [Salaquimonas sp.]